MSVSVFESLDNLPPFDCELDYTQLEPFVRLREAFGSVPERCRSCVFLRALGENALGEVIDYVNEYHHTMHKLDADHEAQRAEAEQRVAFGRLLMSRMEAAGYEIPEGARQTSAEQVLEFGKQIEGMILESDREDALMAIQVFEQGHSGCDGPLELSGVKAKKEFVVTVCTSDVAIDNAEDPLEYPTAVQAKRI